MADKVMWKSGGAAGGGGYFLAFLGALIYYWQHAHSFWDVIIGLFKAIFWPGFLVYQLFNFLHM